MKVGGREQIPQAEKLLITLDEAARMLSMSRTQMYGLTRQRSALAVPLPVVRVGRRLLFRRESLARWVADLEAASKPAP